MERSFLKKKTKLLRCHASLDEKELAATFRRNRLETPKLGVHAWKHFQAEE